MERHTPTGYAPPIVAARRGGALAGIALPWPRHAVISDWDNTFTGVADRRNGEDVDPSLPVVYAAHDLLAAGHLLVFATARRPDDFPLFKVPYDEHGNIDLAAFRRRRWMLQMLSGSYVILDNGGIIAQIDAQLPSRYRIVHEITYNIRPTFLALQTIVQSHCGEKENLTEGWLGYRHLKVIVERSDQPSRVISYLGESLGKWYNPNARYVPFDSLPMLSQVIESHTSYADYATRVSLVYDAQGCCQDDVARILSASYQRRGKGTSVIDYPEHPGLYNLVDPRTPTKAIGARYLLEHVVRFDGYLCAIGDGRTEIPLFAMADISVAMGNAPADVQQAASLVTDTAANDGWCHVAQFLLRAGRGEVAPPPTAAGMAVRPAVQPATVPPTAVVAPHLDTSLSLPRPAAGGYLLGPTSILPNTPDRRTPPLAPVYRLPAARTNSRRANLGVLASPAPRITLRPHRRVA